MPRKSAKRTRIQKSFDRSTWIKIAIIAAVVVAIGLATFFLLRNSAIFSFIGGGGGESGGVTAQAVTSTAEASSRLTDVAGDITGFREELDSLTRIFSSGSETSSGEGAA